jgi:ABC-2 type transport system permease protein
MPSWLQAVAYLNPLSYMVNGLRALLVTGSLEQLPGDVAILALVTAVISIISAYMYPKVVV